MTEPTEWARDVFDMLEGKPVPCADCGAPIDGSEGDAYCADCAPLTRCGYCGQTDPDAPSARFCGECVAAHAGRACESRPGSCEVCDV